MKNLKNRILACFVCLSMILCMSGIVYAGEEDRVPDLPGGSYSLNVHLHTSNGTNITGASMSIHKVAALNEKGGAAFYDMTSDFSSVKERLNDDTTVEKLLETAKKCDAIVSEKGLTGITGTTDGNGKVDFSDLEPGAYLVRVDSYSDSDDRYTKAQPYIVLVPGIGKDEKGLNYWISEVKIEPKVEILCSYVTVDPPVEKRVEGNPSEDSTFMFELKAEDSMNPMPAGSENGVKTITIDGAGKTEFGEWAYTEPGTYKYTIREIDTKNKRYDYDETVYNYVDTTFYEDGELKVDTEITDAQGNEVTEIVFTNVYNPPKIIKIVKTGDTALMTLVIGFIALIGLACLIFMRRRTKDEEVDE